MSKEMTIDDIVRALAQAQRKHDQEFVNLLATQLANRLWCEANPLTYEEMRKEYGYIEPKTKKR